MHDLRLHIYFLNQLSRCFYTKYILVRNLAARKRVTFDEYQILDSLKTRSKIGTLHYIQTVERQTKYL